MKQQQVTTHMKAMLVMLFFCFTFGVTGCAQKRAVTPFVPPVPKASLEEVRAYYIARLAHNGVQVIRVGEDVHIVLRDDYIFIPDSANMRSNAKPIVALVARLMKTYTTVNVKVAGYLDNQGSKDYLQALSTRQAQVVANALWDHGVDARLLYAVGYNQLNPVGWNGASSDRQFNRRVEISFRYYPKFKSYE